MDHCGELLKIDLLHFQLSALLWEEPPAVAGSGFGLENSTKFISHRWRPHEAKAGFKVSREYFRSELLQHYPKCFFSETLDDARIVWHWLMPTYLEGARRAYGGLRAGYPFGSFGLLRSGFFHQQTIKNGFLEYTCVLSLTLILLKSDLKVKDNLNLKA